MNLLTINLERKNTLYLELYKSIKDKIIKGELKPLEKMPSKRALASHLDISINTVIQSYNLLIDEGYIISIPRKGYFVEDYKIPYVDNTTYEEFSIKSTYKYDLTTKNIDSSIFPYYTWGKIGRDALTYDKSIIYKTDSCGDFTLRNTISKYLYQTKGVNVNPKNIIIGSGIEYLLTNLIGILPIKNCAIENPGYDKLNKILKNNNIDVSYISLDQYGFNINECKNSDVIYVTPANQFPTGIKMPLQRKMELIKWAGNDKYIIEDDFDSEFRYLSNTSTPILSLNPNQVIFISSFSRTIAPSLRISYMILPNSILDLYIEKYSFYSQTTSTMDQKILNTFIEQGHYSRHLNKTKNLYNKKKNRILENLSKIPNITIIPRGYLSIGLLVDNLDINKFNQKKAQYSIDVNTISSFYFTKTNETEIIIGYSSINFELIDEACSKLILLINESIL